MCHVGEAPNGSGGGEHRPVGTAHPPTLDRSLGSSVLMAERSFLGGGDVKTMASEPRIQPIYGPRPHLTPILDETYGLFLQKIGAKQLLGRTPASLSRRAGGRGGAGL